MHQNFFSPNAIAYISGGNDYPDLFGRVKFYQKRNCVLVEADIQNLPETGTGFFGFHIHEGNSCTGENFSDTGNHYNPSSAPHPDHAGDLPPLILCNNGAYMTVVTDRFTVADILGKTVVIHSNPDDFHTQPSGNAGTKIACGNIEWAQYST